MLSILFNKTKKDLHREGEIYREFTLFGEFFSLKYGYYDEQERNDPEAEPMILYPDFEKQPKFTADGFPFVTKMQDACRYYKGKGQTSCECAECIYYKHGEELIGICTCYEKREKVTTTEEGK